MPRKSRIDTLGALRQVVARGINRQRIFLDDEAIRAFAGANAEAAVVPQKVHDIMVDYDRVGRHYEVVLGAQSSAA